MSKALEAIAKLQQQIAQLKDSAITELQARRIQLQAELKTIDADIEHLTVKPPRAPRTARVPGAPSRPRSNAPEGKKPDLQQLKALLAEAPGKTILLRKEGYDVRNVKIMAMANPTLLRMGGLGPWPTMTLLKWAIPTPNRVM